MILKEKAELEVELKLSRVGSEGEYRRVVFSLEMESVMMSGRRERRERERESRNSGHKQAHSDRLC